MGDFTSWLRTKRRKCPFCGHRLIDIVLGSTIVLIIQTAKDDQPDFILKCHCCGKEVGIRTLKYTIE